jgi:hypothetical protein
VAASTIGDHGPVDTIADFSSSGPTPTSLQLKPDVTAPGVDILSSFPDKQWTELQGTSMAAPHVAGQPHCSASGIRHDGRADQVGARSTGDPVRAPSSTAEGVAFAREADGSICSRRTHCRCEPPPSPGPCAGVAASRRSRPGYRRRLRTAGRPRSPRAAPAGCSLSRTPAAAVGARSLLNAGPDAAEGAMATVQPTRHRRAAVLGARGAENAGLALDASRSRRTAATPPARSLSSRATATRRAASQACRPTSRGPSRCSG